MEDWRSQNDEMFRWVWEAVEDEANKARIAKGEEEGTKERENVKRKKKRVWKTNDRRRNGQY